MQLEMLFPVWGKLKYIDPSLNSLPGFFENMRKSSYKIENGGNLWKLWDLLFLIRAGRQLLCSDNLLTDYEQLSYY